MRTHMFCQTLTFLKRFFQNGSDNPKTIWSSIEFFSFQDQGRPQGNIKRKRQRQGQRQQGQHQVQRQQGQRQQGQ